MIKLEQPEPTDADVQAMLEDNVSQRSSPSTIQAQIAVAIVTLLAATGVVVWNVVKTVKKDEKSTQTEVIVATPSAPTPEEELLAVQTPNVPDAGSFAQDTADTSSTGEILQLGVVGSDTSAISLSALQEWLDEPGDAVPDTTTSAWADVEDAISAPQEVEPIYQASDTAVPPWLQENAAEELDTDTVSASAFEVMEDIVIAAAEPVVPLTDAAVAADIDNTAGISEYTEFCFDEPESESEPAKPTPTAEPKPETRILSCDWTSGKQPKLRCQDSLDPAKDLAELPIEWTYQNDNNGANLGYIVVDTGYSIAKTMEPVGIDLKKPGATGNILFVEQQ
ncbi:MAG: hypothetical protein AAB893_03590 [Patescibacteria group bacterium]|mgnify:CR=1 FL=1